MFAAMSSNVALALIPNIWRNIFALVRVSAIKGIVKPPLSTPLAYSSGSVMFVRT